MIFLCAAVSVFEITFFRANVITNVSFKGTFYRHVYNLGHLKMVTLRMAEFFHKCSMRHSDALLHKSQS